VLCCAALRCSGIVLQILEEVQRNASLKAEKAAAIKKRNATPVEQTAAGHQVSYYDVEDIDQLMDAYAIRDGGKGGLQPGSASGAGPKKKGKSGKKGSKGSKKGSKGASASASADKGEGDFGEMSCCPMSTVLCPLSVCLSACLSCISSDFVVNLSHRFAD
jgi:hypothetical protein